MKLIIQSTEQGHICIIEDCSDLGERTQNLREKVTKRSNEIYQQLIDKFGQGKDSLIGKCSHFCAELVTDKGDRLIMSPYVSDRKETPQGYQIGARVTPLSIISSQEYIKEQLKVRL